MNKSIGKSFSTEIIAAEENKLILQTKSYDERGFARFRLVKLKGVWQSDDCNRLMFTARKEDSPDVFILQGAWEVNKNQQITYTWERQDLERKRKILNTVVFEGFWQIDAANKLTYILGSGNNSRFDFRAQLESPNLYPQTGKIKYRLGIGYGRQEKRTISLYGEWKFSKKLGLSFVMDYGKGCLQSIEFGAQVFLNKKDEITFSVLNRKGEPLGFSVAFEHSFLKKTNAKAFLRFKKLQQESRVEAGLKIPF